MKKSRRLELLYGVMTVAFLVLSLVLRYGGKSVYFSGFLTLWVEQNISEGSAWNIILYIIAFLVCIAVPYMIGSSNFAIMLSRERHNDDIRKYGSKNAGMTNMIRVYGKKDGIETAVGDALKTSASVLLGRFLTGEFGAYLAALFCVLGHIAPIWYKFKGGKGVIASAIAMLVLDPIYFLFVFAAFCLVYFTTHFVSMGSIAGAFIYPAVVYYGARVRSDGESLASPPAMIFAVFVGVMVIFMHRANIRRVYYGEESKLYLRKKKPKKHDDEV